MLYIVQRDAIHNGVRVLVIPCRSLMYDNSLNDLI